MPTPKKKPTTTPTPAAADRRVRSELLEKAVQLLGTCMSNLGAIEDSLMDTDNDTERVHRLICELESVAEELNEIAV
jgi:hypothetical protein